FTIYETLLLIKAELVHHFSKEEIEFEEFLSDDNVDFSSLIAEHEKTIGLFDRIKYLSHDFSLKANYEKIKDVNEDLFKLDSDMRRHIYIENEFLFKNQE
ncbi:MAG: ScdA protein, partial [Anaerococcus sp.]